MADASPDDTREKIVADWCPDYSEAGQRTLLAELDRVDPLRTLLADEDGARALITRNTLAAGASMLHARAASARVLAALREVAGL